jgi:hypothetical protein
MSHPFSIRFPLVIERSRVGRRVFRRLVADKTGLRGAQYCAAGMITCALGHRDTRHSQFPDLVETYRKIARLGMRESALWARVFARQIDQHDPRLDAVAAERRRLVQEFCARTAA